MGKTPDPLLAQCAASGQLSASQVHQHVQAGELPVQMLGAEPAFTTLPDAEYRRMQYLADYAAVVIIESHARRSGCPKALGPVYDISTPDEEELPDEKTLAEMAREIDMTAAHLTERGMLVRPWSDSPQLVTLVKP